MGDPGKAIPRSKMTAGRRDQVRATGDARGCVNSPGPGAIEERSPEPFRTRTLSQYEQDELTT